MASTQDIDTLIARVKEEAGLANFNKDAVERENALYQREAEAKLDAESVKWEKYVSNLKHKPNRPSLLLKQTPLAMHLVGADFKELYVAPHAFDGLFPKEKNNLNHNIHLNIDDDVLKKIPQALADPVAVYRDNRNVDRFIFVTNITDKKGATLVIPVDFKGNTDRAEINIILSVFAKNNKKDEPSMNWFLEQAEKLVYVNRNKDKYFGQKK